jgi:nucleoside-diphosphate-sugar epimerase
MSTDAVIAARQTILVTGANGLVGQAVCRALARQGHQVFAAMREPHRLAHDQVKPVQAPDLADPQGQWPLNGVDVVVHTAARVHIMGAQGQDVAAYNAINCEGTQRLAQACVAAGVKRLVFLSTIKVHGEQTQAGRPFRRDDPLMPSDPYAQSKAQAEQALFALSQQGLLQVTVVRAPLVYARGARANLHTLKRWIDRGWPLPIGALDQNRRSLVSLANLVDLLACCVGHPGAANQAFLVSDGHDVSTLQLAQAIAAASERPLRTWSVPPRLLAAVARLLGRQAMVQRLTENLQIDMTATETQLGWRAPESLAQGMRDAFGRPDQDA